MLQVIKGSFFLTDLWGLGKQHLSKSSPTFGIVNEYKTKSGTVYHFDAYRIENEDEAYDFGIEEYLDSGKWCLIEWPDKIKNVLPLENELFSIDIQLDNESRSYEF